MSEGSDNKNLVLGLISTGRDRPSVREKPMASPPPAKTDDDGGALPIAAAGRTQFRDLVAKGAVRKNEKVKVLGTGEIAVKLNVAVDKVSSSAEQKIVAAGGSVK